MEPEIIQRYHQWNQEHGDELDSIIGASRQIAHLSGISLTPKGRWKKQGNSSFLKFSASPKPLKWKGSKGWERLIVIIKNHDQEISFCLTIDGKPIGIGPNAVWHPIRKSNEIMEKAVKKLERS